ncbi:Hypothetical predicted protein [Olea europaea subsp. europaea]|uniref:Uncharacterized protein n=1 Tax=Olea europaea subsp. europaea TaxID=158383 RepID=A0A8S0SKP8_OLEEU|nr:Hypothetical predicted protein [Olea europaea subsp. europaea]
MLSMTVLLPGRYLVLANMLMISEVNPLDGQEAKPYKNDPEILAMTNLIAAYQRNEILEFEKILKVQQYAIICYLLLEYY